MKKQSKQEQILKRICSKITGHKSNRLAENLGVKNAKWDKKEGYFVPRDCYNSYFYKVEDETTDIITKLILHGKKLWL